MRIVVMVTVTYLGVHGAGSANQVEQSASKLKAERVRFEVVSIRPCQSATSWIGAIKASPGRLRLECFTVEDLIRLAYVGYPDGRPLRTQNGVAVPNVLPHESTAALKAGPSWTRSKRFTIDATTGPSPTTQDKTGLLMQDVLKERFKLRIHEQSQQLAVYELIQRKGGAKLQMAKDGSCVQLDPAKASPPLRASGGQAPPPICAGFRVSPAGGVDAYHVTLPGLCLQMSHALDRDVIDKTGIEGVFDLHLETTLQELSRFRSQYRSIPQPPPSAIPEASDPVGSIFTAMRKLGLQLQPGRRLAKLIVIDHVEIPDGN